MLVSAAPTRNFQVRSAAHSETRVINMDEEIFDALGTDDACARLRPPQELQV